MEINNELKMLSYIRSPGCSAIDDPDDPEALSFDRIPQTAVHSMAFTQRLMVPPVAPQVSG